MTPSIRRRLTVSLLLTLFAVFAAGIVALYVAVRGEFIESFDDALIAQARAISTLVTVDDDGTVRLDFSDRFMRGFDDDEAHDFFQLWDADGRTLERSESLEDEPDLPLRTDSLKDPEYFFLRLAHDKPARAVGIEFEPRPARRHSKVDPPELRLVVATRSEHLDHELRELLVGTAAWAAGLLLVIALLVPWLLYRGLKPLDRLAGEVARVDAATLDTRFPTTGLPRELTPITTTLNALFARLGESFERERRVTAAMAHELRTPIAELRASAETALKWPDARPPETDSDALAIATQMEAIVTRMLALARSESGQLVATIGRVDLPEALRRAWQPLLPLAQARGMRAEFDVAPAALDADPALLQSILTNLLENAVHYGPEGGVISVAGDAGAEGYRLAVSNEAPGFAAADLDHLFERFWRGEAARSGGVHMGLGLALVREFARAMGWEVSARLDPPQTLVIALRASPPVT